MAGNEQPPTSLIVLTPRTVGNEQTPPVVNRSQTPFGWLYLLLQNNTTLQHTHNRSKSLHSLPTLSYCCRNLRTSVGTLLESATSWCSQQKALFPFGCFVQTLGKLIFDIPGMHVVTGNMQWGNVSFQFPSIAQHFPQPACVLEKKWHCVRRVHGECRQLSWFFGGGTSILLHIILHECLKNNNNNINKKQTRKLNIAETYLFLDTRCLECVHMGDEPFQFHWSPRMLPYQHFHETSSCLKIYSSCFSHFCFHFWVKIHVWYMFPGYFTSPCGYVESNTSLHWCSCLLMTLYTRVYAECYNIWIPCNLHLH